MARSLNGNLLGAAARIERDEIRQELRERSLRFQEDWYDTLNRLKDLDPDGWEKFYDACPQQTAGEMLPIIKERIELIEQLNWPEVESKDFERTRQDLIESGHPF
jgi:hypothetical protein